MADETDSQQPREAPKRIDLNGLFTLHRQHDGTYRAEFGKLTVHRERALWMGLSCEALDLVQTLVFFASEPERMFEAIPEIPSPIQDDEGRTNINDIYATGKHAKTHLDFVATCVVSPFVKLFGDELKVFINPNLPGPERSKARKQISKRFERILESIEKRRETPRHGSTAVAPFRFPDGTVVEMPAPWLLLYVARDLVQAIGRLPTKGALRWAFEDNFPTLKGLSERKWSQIWNTAGLTELAEVEAWEVIKAKRRARNARSTKNA